MMCQVLKDKYGDILKMGNGGTMCHENILIIIIIIAQLMSSPYFSLSTYVQ
jgi:hypothetical protein